MKNADEMSPQELRELADQKEQSQINKVIKIGFLKEDLWTPPYTYGKDDADTEEYIHIINTDAKNKMIQGYIDSFDPLSKGSKFTCVLTKYGPVWYDKDGEEYEDDFAERYLENIQEVTE